MSFHLQDGPFSLPTAVSDRTAVEQHSTTLPIPDSTFTSSATGGIAKDFFHTQKVRGRQVLEARRNDSNSPQYTAEQVAALQQRGEQFLRERRERRQSHHVFGKDGCAENSSEVGGSGSLHTFSASDIFAANPSNAELAESHGVTQRQQRQQKQITQIGTAVASNSEAAQDRGHQGYVSMAEVDCVLEDLICKFNAHMAQCEAANKQWWAEVTQLHAAYLASLTAERDAALEQLREQQTSSSMSLACLQSELEQSRGTLTDMSRRCEELEEENKRMQSLLVDREENLTRAQENAQTSRAVCKQVNKELEESRAELLRLQERNAEQASELQRASTEVRELVLSREQNYQLIDELREAQLALEADRTRSKELFEEEKAHVGRLRAEVETLEQKIATLVDKTPNVCAFSESSLINVTGGRMARAGVAGSSLPGAHVIAEELLFANLRIADLEAKLGVAQAALADLQPTHRLFEGVSEAAGPLDAEDTGRERFAAEPLLLRERRSSTTQQQSTVETAAAVNVTADNPFAAFSDPGADPTASLTSRKNELSLSRVCLSPSHLRTGLAIDWCATNEASCNQHSVDSLSHDEKGNIFTGAHAKGAAADSICLLEGAPVSNPFAALSAGERQQQNYTHQHIQQGNSSAYNYKEELVDTGNSQLDLFGMLPDNGTMEDVNEFSDLHQQQHEAKVERGTPTTEEMQTESHRDATTELHGVCNGLAEFDEVYNPWQHMPDTETCSEPAFVELPFASPLGVRKSSSNADVLQSDACNVTVPDARYALTLSANDSSFSVCSNQEREHLLSATEGVPATESRVHELERQVHMLLLRLAAYERERSQPISGMEEIGRKYADVQHRLLLSEQDNADLIRQLDKIRSFAPGKELNVAKTEHHLAADKNASRDACFIVTESADLIDTHTEADTFDYATSDLALVAANDEAQCGEASREGRKQEDGHDIGPGTATLQHLFRTDGDSSTTIYKEDNGGRHSGLGTTLLIDGAKGCEEEEDEERELTRVASRCDELVAATITMEDFGHRYADAQHRLALAEEARINLESEVQMLRIRAEDLEMRLREAQQNAPPVSGADSFGRIIEPSLQNPFRRPPFSALEDDSVGAVALGEGGRLSHPQLQVQCAGFSDGQSKNIFPEELQHQIEELEAQHVQELANLAEKAADQIAELEETYKLRIASMEDELKRHLSRQCQSGSCIYEDRYLQLFGSPSDVGGNDVHIPGIDFQSIEVRRLNGALEGMKLAIERLQADHEAELEAVAAEIDAQFSERDQALEKQLGEQCIFYEGRIAELEAALQQQHETFLRCVGAEAINERGTPSNGAAAPQTVNWREEHAKLSLRFEQLQCEHENFMENTRILRESHQVNQEHDTVPQQIRELQGRLEVMNVHMHAMRDDLHERDQQLQFSQSELQEVRAQFNMRVTQLEDLSERRLGEIERLTQSNNELTEVLQNGADTAKVELQKQQEQLAEANRRIHQLVAQLSGSQVQHAQCFDAIGRLREAEGAVRQQLLQAESSQRDFKICLLETECRFQEEQGKGHLVNLQDRHACGISDFRKQSDKVCEEFQVFYAMIAAFSLEGHKSQNRLESLKQHFTDTLDTNNHPQALLQDAGEVVRLFRNAVCDGDPNQGDLVNSSSNGDPHISLLLERIEQLESRVQALTNDCNVLQQEKSALDLELKNFVGVMEVREQVMHRQENELQRMYPQLLVMREDLMQRVRSHQRLAQELDQVNEHAIELATAYEELQRYSIRDAHCISLQQHVEALLMAKVMGLPHLLQDYLSAIFSGLSFFAEVVQQQKLRLNERCDAIECAAAEALKEGERHTETYELALTCAHMEQQSMKKVLEGLQADQRAAKEAQAQAVANAKKAEEELFNVKRRAQEDVFRAQQDLQVARLEHADMVRQVKLLQGEVSSVNQLLEKWSERYETRERSTEEELNRAFERTQTLEQMLEERRKKEIGERAQWRDTVATIAEARDEALCKSQALQVQLDCILPCFQQLGEERVQHGAELMDTAQRISGISTKSSSEEEVTCRHLSDLERMLRELSIAYDLLQKLHTAGEALSGRLKNQLQVAEQSLVHVTGYKERLERELEEAAGRLEEMETTHSRNAGDTQTRLHDTECRLRNCEQRNEILQHKQCMLQERFRYTQSQLDESQGELRRVTDEHNSLRTLHDQQSMFLEQRISSLERDLTELQEVHHEASARINDLEMKLAQKQAEMEHMSQKLNETNALNLSLNTQTIAACEEHKTELYKEQHMLAEAHRELHQCRKLMSEAEVKKLDMDNELAAVHGENRRLHEDLAAARIAFKTDQYTHQATMQEKRELIVSLQNQVKHLHGELSSTQAELKMRQHTTAVLEDTIKARDHEVAVEAKKVQAIRREYEIVRGELVALGELHRCEHFGTQAELNHTDDRIQERARNFTQHKEKMDGTVGVYKKSEQNLGQESADLLVALSELSASLLHTPNDRETAGVVRMQQDRLLQVATAELKQLREQIARDTCELTHLKIELQKRSIEVEHCRRDAAVRAEIINGRVDADQRVAWNALEEELCRERQFTLEARVARDRALVAMDRRQKELEAHEVKLNESQGQLRRAQEEAESLRSQLNVINAAALQAAGELGLCDSHDVDDGHRNFGDRSSPNSDRDSVDSTIGDHQGGSVGRRGRSSLVPVVVINVLMDRLSIFSFAASTLELEDAQINELCCAIREHQNQMTKFNEWIVSCNGDVSNIAQLSASVEGYPGVVSAPRRHSADGAVSNPLTPLQPDTPIQSHAHEQLLSSPHSGNDHQSTCQVNAVKGAGVDLLPQRYVTLPFSTMEQLTLASSTFCHRVEGHVGTLRQLLRSLVLAIGGDQADGVGPGGGVWGAKLLDDTGGEAACSKACVLAVPHVKLLVTGTTARLHSHVAALTRAVERLHETCQSSSCRDAGAPFGLLPEWSAVPSYSPFLSAALPALGGVSLRLGPGAALCVLVQRTLCIFREAERYALRPFSELLSDSNVEGMLPARGDLVS